MFHEARLSQRREWWERWKTDGCQGFVLEKRQESCLEEGYSCWVLKDKQEFSQVAKRTSL